MDIWAVGMRHEFKSEDVSVRSERMSVSGDEFEWVWGDGVERERQQEEKNGCGLSGMKRVVLKRNVAYMRKGMVSGMSYGHERNRGNGYES